jgi:choline dehydrogenase-like flavoprotein
MQGTRKQREYDAIIVGSGTGGATIARELSRQRRKVLILERGGNVALKENFRTIASIADQVKLGDGGLAAARALTTGGSTGLYFGVVSYPHLDTFNALGIDLSGALEAVRKELPIASLPDEMLGEKSRRLRDTALSLGHAWEKRDMLVDLQQCKAGYSYEAKWKARTYVDDALRHGATLVTRATVQKILVEDGRAVGVAYRTKKGMGGSELRHVYGAKVILAAGELATPRSCATAASRAWPTAASTARPGTRSTA